MPGSGTRRARGARRLVQGPRHAGAPDAGDRWATAGPAWHAAAERRRRLGLGAASVRAVAPGADGACETIVGHAPALSPRRAVEVVAASAADDVRGRRRALDRLLCQPVRSA